MLAPLAVLLTLENMVGPNAMPTKGQSQHLASCRETRTTERARTSEPLIIVLAEAGVLVLSSSGHATNCRNVGFMTVV